MTITLKTESYECPDRFMKQMQKRINEMYPVSSKSVLYSSYNFYQDLLLRHTSTSSDSWYTSVKSAFSFFNSEGKHELISYKQMSKDISFQAYIWENSGVKSGHKIALIHTGLYQQVCSCLAALKLGCAFSVLSPESPLLLKNRIEELKPDFISTELEWIPLIRGYHSHIIPLQQTPEQFIEDTYAYAYKPNEIACISYNFQSETSCIPIELSAEELYLNLMRNGYQVLGLSSKSTIAYPLTDNMLYNPGLLLTSCMFGAHYVDISIKTLQHLPKLFKKKYALVLGVNSHVRDYLTENVLPINTCAFYFSPLDDAYQVPEWQQFVTECLAQNVPSAYLRWESAIQGFGLKSLVPVGQLVTEVLPIEGRPFFLTDVFDKTLASQTGMGLYTCQVNHSLQFVSQCTLTETENGYSYYEENTLKKNGKPFPKADITHFLNTQTTPKFNYIFIGKPLENKIKNHSISLLVFHTNATLSNELHLKNAVIKQLSDAVGRQYLPDEIQFLRVQPRGFYHTDENWILQQIQLGKLNEKSQDDFYYWTSKFRCLLQKQHPK